ncbi:MAG: porin family protein [Candidatus Aminicenantes bacterium]|nr:porin family protein [Candidatus Aminicenantes bacterium]MDH5714424.1 porin family protein [Candidatus Aminicenantes bacterium]
MKLVRVLSLVLLLTMLFSGLLSAQQKRERFEVAIYTGAGLKGSEHRLFDEIKLTYGFGFTYRLSKRYGIEAELAYLPFSADVDLDKLGISLHVLSRIYQVKNYRLLLGINGLIYVFEKQRIKPFIVLGLGWLHDFNHIEYSIIFPTEDSNIYEWQEVKDRKNDLQFPNIGIGFNYLIKEDAFLRVKLVFHQPGSKELQTTCLVAGFGFRF